jgi:transposase
VRRTYGRWAQHSPDLAWSGRAAARARAAPAEVRVLYADAVTLVRQPSLADVYAPRGYQPTVPLTTQPNDTYRSCGALDLVSGQVTWLGAQSVGVDRLKRFLRKLRGTSPAQQRFLVCDNGPVHQHPAVLAVAAELGIELVWLPTYAPWTNPIEKLWRQLKQAVLQSHRLVAHWPELKAPVAAFLNPFIDGSAVLLR